ncbi:MAG: hypothetical protein U0M08_01040 [Clostridia bacterium]|nr:hypothetical protein [Clostridia bacterium]
MRNFIKGKARSFFLLIFSCVLVAGITGVYALVCRPEEDAQKERPVQDRQIARDNESVYNAEETEIAPQLKAS